MSKNHAAIGETAEAYYKAIQSKDIAGVAKCLHPDVTFTAPLAKMQGKEAVLKGTKDFMEFFQTYTIRATFSSGDQAMIAYDLGFAAPIGTVPTAGLLTFQDGLVAKIELFYDARRFEAIA